MVTTRRSTGHTLLRRCQQGGVHGSVDTTGCHRGPVGRMRRDAVSDEAKTTAVRASGELRPASGGYARRVSCTSARTGKGAQRGGPPRCARPRNVGRRWRSLGRSVVTARRDYIPRSPSNGASALRREVHPLALPARFLNRHPLSTPRPPKNALLYPHASTNTRW